jgi:hypothetical protein
LFRHLLVTHFLHAHYSVDIADSLQ